MAKLTKKQRVELREMFGGRCAYCGCELPEKGWHADHVEAALRKWEFGERHPNGTRRTIATGEFWRPENDEVENLFPACAPCNLFKATFSVETFRSQIAARDVLKERLRQIKEESWTPEHDDQHSNGELSFAAISYLMAVVNPNASHGWWPWDVKSWNPSSDFRHNLVRAGALILAEIDRLDRKEKAND